MPWGNVSRRLDKKHILDLGREIEGGDGVVGDGEGGHFVDNYSDIETEIPWTDLYQEGGGNLGGGIFMRGRSWGKLRGGSQ